MCLQGSLFGYVSFVTILLLCMEIIVYISRYNCFVIYAEELGSHIVKLCTHCLWFRLCKEVFEPNKYCKMYGFTLHGLDLRYPKTHRQQNSLAVNIVHCFHENESLVNEHLW